MTKIKQLFNSLEQIVLASDIQNIFDSAGMVCEYAQLEYGFFPLGSGVLTEDSNIELAEILNCEVMVLGNDFGTLKYLKENCPNRRELNSTTIKNLLSLGLRIENNFFTNFYLGLRNNEKFPGMTMTKLIVDRSECYQKFCFEFFKVQLEIMNPRIVICLGKQVGFALYESMKGLFTEFEKKSMNLSKLYTSGFKQYILNSQNDVLGNRTFLFIPHPSYAHINWTKHDIKEKIKVAIKREIATLG